METERPNDGDEHRLDTPDATPAWEEIETGRFQPKRIRGSYRGRTLG